MLQIDCTSTYKSVYETVSILYQDLPQEIRVRHNENRRSSKVNPAEELKIIAEQTSCYVNVPYSTYVTVIILFYPPCTMPLTAASPAHLFCWNQKCLTGWWLWNRTYKVS